ncbi:unnamed protein product [Kuraishia capsulata CBS 1993]|uniref:Hydantoinase/oxoprolinase N-terminal domain-containing protein n=1 Tax=Kuraishia capsulata CBS 1993 TaxID=1382522 RepID=W6MIE8_9ASCO|nr:uncharacterized protein KUCA_T00002205001 [Kuraishia capsulata CBS 1993]CDK26234.1 unnamed protein product [Kuraishia capsulata CBS 1993]
MTKSKSLLIGVDVGGTNTDSVLINPLELESQDSGVLAFHKSATTLDVSDGIQKAIANLFEQRPDISKQEVASVTIGTTHFINAVVEQDRAKLERVAVIRLAGPFSQFALPFSDFPAGLAHILNGYHALLDGGHRVDGTELRPLDVKGLQNHAEKIKELGINAIVVNGQFSPMYRDHELRAAEIIRSIIPSADVIMSHTVSTIGFIEREDASILNAAVISFAKKIIASFKGAVKSLGLSCPVMLTQNDGTVLSTEEAIRTPVKTFSSGATNSMRGAALLCSKEKAIQGKSVIVVDVGGTTTDVGLLLPTGFPRQSSAYSLLGGVRTNFSMPQVESIGLGGGSRVRVSENEISVGPDSVGSNIIKDGLVFEGSITTATDVTVAIGQDDVSIRDKSLYEVGNPDLVRGKFDEKTKAMFTAELKAMMERVIDRMKTSPEPLPVLLVGGGSFIAPDHLDGASVVLRPPYFGVVNAIGAAIGKISATVQTIKHIQPGEDKDIVLEQLKAQALEEAVAKGALRDTVVTVDLLVNPIPYVPNTIEFLVKVIGDVDYEHVQLTSAESANDGEIETGGHVVKDSSFSNDKITHVEVEFDAKTYVPHINSEKEWILSEVDAEFLRIGTYILGCGGGGTPYHHWLALRHIIRSGQEVKIIEPSAISKYTPEGDEGCVLAVGYAGSPTVAYEQLAGVEMFDAYKMLARFTGREPFATLSYEIGGGNGLTGLKIAAELGVPCIDGDLMGRAYPTIWQMIPMAYSDKTVFTPGCLSDGNGNTIIMPEAANDVLLEKVFRASLAEIGAHCGAVTYINNEDIAERSILNSCSLSWKIGRAVHIARQESKVEALPEIIIDAVGGCESGKCIFKGKIVRVEKKLFKGHVYGEIDIENDDRSETLTIPFKNENIYCEKALDGVKEIVASVPDLISVNDKDTGEALGTQDYRYGLLVFVLVIAPSNRWTDTKRAIENGGPKGFGYEFDYKPSGKYTMPTSVIEEYYK